MPSFAMFLPVDMPETCYPIEAIYWVALGRVPEVDHWGSEVDVRVDKEAILEREGTIPIYFEFSELEFRSINIEVDFPRYIKAKRDCFHFDPGKDEAEAVDVYVKMRPADHLTPEEKVQVTADLEKMVADVRHHYHEGRWAASMEARFDHVLDIAWASVFKKLATGEMKAFGWRRIGDLPDDFGEDQIELTDISPTDWKLSAFDLQNSVLTVEGGEYQAVQIWTAEMLSLFPAPSSPPTRVAGNAFPGGVLILDGRDDDPPQGSVGNYADPTPASPKPKPRGPRPRGHGTDQRSIVRNLFEKRWLEEEKQDALISEIQAFCSQAFDDKTPPGRSTVQSWFPPRRPKKPAIEASNSREISA